MLKFFEIAKKINSEKSDILKKRELHCRGGRSSMSLISISKEKPEIGFPGLKTEGAVLRKIDEWESLKRPDRPTPEKKIQAWLIKNAVNHENHYLKFGDKIKFITSELSLIHNDGKKVVSDILGYSEDCLFIIELKSDRSMTRLIEQVERFHSAVEDNKDFLSRLLRLHGCEWNGKSTKKVIVWPYLASPKTTKCLIERDIIEYGYSINADNFYTISKIE